METSKQQMCPFKVGEMVECAITSAPKLKTRDWPGSGWRHGKKFTVARITACPNINDFILWPARDAGVYATAIEPHDWDD